jgi:hypothetical protein
VKLNISSLKDFQRCEKMAYYRHDLQRSKLGQVSQPLDVGTIWHKGMEAYMQRENCDEVGEIFLREITNLPDRDYTAKAATQLNILLDGLRVWQKPVDWNLRSVETVLQAQLPRWRKSLHHSNDPILVGRLDAIIEWNGLWWHVQHKTIDAAKPIKVFWEQMARDWHECGYHYLMERNGIGPIGGTLLITARKVSAKALKENPFQVITHQFISRPQPVIDKAVDDIYTIMERWKHNQDDTRVMGGPNSYIENRDSCTGPYGNRACAYMEVCNGLVQLGDDALFETTQRTYE